MDKPQVFQFVVILHPTEKSKEEGEMSKVIVPVKEVLAMDASAATLKAGREIPEEHMDKLDRIEVAVRPF